MDRDIIEACKKGDKAAQKKLFEHYLAAMLVLCRRYVKDSNDAEELALNGFYKFFVGIGNFVYTDGKSTMAWLKKIMVNECLMFLRKRSKLIFVAEDAVGEPAIDSTVIGRLNAEDLYKLIGRLSDGYRIVFNMYVIEGYGHKEIAAVLGISESASRSQLARARAILQKLLKENGAVYEQR